MEIVQVDNRSSCAECGKIPFNKNNEVFTSMVYK